MSFAGIPYITVRWELSAIKRCDTKIAKTKMQFASLFIFIHRWPSMSIRYLFFRFVRCANSSSFKNNYGKVEKSLSPFWLYRFIVFYVANMPRSACLQIKVTFWRKTRGSNIVRTNLSNSELCQHIKVSNIGEDVETRKRSCITPSTRVCLQKCRKKIFSFSCTFCFQRFVN